MLLGLLTIRHFNRLLQNLFPNGNGIPFCNAIFRTFGNSENKTGQYLDFKEFLRAMNINNLKTEEVVVEISVLYLPLGIVSLIPIAN